MNLYAIILDGRAYENYVVASDFGAAQRLYEKSNVDLEGNYKGAVISEIKYKAKNIKIQSYDEHGIGY